LEAVMHRSATFAPPARLPWSRRHAALDRLRERLSDPSERPELLWETLWAPYTVWSDAPAPERMRRTAPLPRDLGLAGEAVVNGIDRIRRRMWTTHALAAIFRGIWLGLAVACVLMLVDALRGPVFDPVVAAAIAAPLLLGGLVMAGLSKPSRARTARMLDRTFGLQERMATAIDDLGLGVPEPGARAPVVYLQMADAANALAALRTDRRLRPGLPVREIVLVVLVALVLATLAFLRGLGGGLPEVESARVPPFTPAIERPAEPEAAAALDTSTMAPTIEEVLERSDRSAQARRELQALAAALADHAVTRPAAEQIARGDYAEAGDRLREAASQASDLSQGSREGLASDLDRAAETMQPETNGLEEATRDAAEGLRQGDQQAETELSDLAEAVEQAGQQVVPQGELAAQMRTARQAEAQRSDSGDASSAGQSGDPSESFAEQSTSGDPGSGADASSSSDGSQSQDGQQSQSGGQQESGAEGQEGQGGEGGPANAPGAAQQPGEGAGGQLGEAEQAGATAGGQEGNADAASARLGGGAGTGEAAEQDAAQAAASGGNQSAGGEEAADPNVSGGDGAEADPNALPGANERVALPGGSGQDGVQTASDGGSALRGSGAGVTAGAGFASQGDVGEAGPDSNRVPPQHRETVERYFSNGSQE
jgi:hypothetical protein